MKRCPSIDGAIALFLAFLTISNGLALLGGTGTGVATTPPTVAPTHIPAVASAKVGAEGVNVYAIYSSEPAPMGIADYGVGASGPYNYTTTEFSGEVAIQSLQAKNATGDPSVGFQLNAVLPIQTANGLRVYWVQDVAQFDTSTNQAYFLDNVWNFSSYSSSMDSSAIRGAGQIGTYTGGQSFYYDWADALPISLPLPAKVTFLVSTALDSSNLPTVTFEYDTGAGLQSYDTVTFTSAKGVTHFTGFEVSGFGYTPAGNYYDSELVLTGA